MIQTLHTSGVIWKLGIPYPLYGSVRGWGLWQECVSASPARVSVGILSVSQCVGVTELVSGFLPEGIAPCVATYSVCQCEKRNSGAFYVTILVQSLPVFQVVINCI